MEGSDTDCDEGFSILTDVDDSAFNYAHKDLITHISMDITGRRMATVSTDKTMAIWTRNEQGNWRRTACFKVHGGAVCRAVWAHPEYGQVIATCSSDRSVHIWEQVKNEHTGRDGKWIRRAYLPDSRNAVTDLAFGPRHLGLVMATVSSHGYLRFYECPDVMELHRWSMVHELKAFHVRMATVTWSHSPIHRTLLVCASDEPVDIQRTDRVCVYELDDGLSGSRKYCRLSALKPDLPAPVTDVQFNPIISAEYHQVAIAAGDVFVYNFKVPAQSFIDEEGTHEPVTTDTEYQLIKVAQLSMGDLKKAWRVRFNLTGNVLVASSGDGTVRVFKSLLMNQWVPLTDVTAEAYLQENEEENRPRGYLAEQGRGIVKEPNVYY